MPISRPQRSRWPLFWIVTLTQFALDPEPHSSFKELRRDRALAHYLGVDFMDLVRRTVRPPRAAPMTLRVTTSHLEMLPVSTRLITSANTLGPMVLSRRRSFSLMKLNQAVNPRSTANAMKRSVLPVLAKAHPEPWPGQDTAISGHCSAFGAGGVASWFSVPAVPVITSTDAVVPTRKSTPSGTSVR